MTEDELAKIRDIAHDGDPFMRGAAWMFDQMASADRGGLSDSQEAQQ